MYRILGVIVLVLAFLTLGFGVLTYTRMREIAMSRNPTNVLEHLDVRIMSTGLISNSPTMSAAKYCQQLSTRAFMVMGVGLVLLLVGGALFIRPANARHGERGRRGAAEDSD